MWPIKDERQFLLAMYYHKREQTARFINIVMSSTYPLKQEQIKLLEEHLIPWASARIQRENRLADRIKKGLFGGKAKFRFKPGKAILRNLNSPTNLQKRIRIKPLPAERNALKGPVKPLTQYINESGS